MKTAFLLQFLTCIVRFYGARLDHHGGVSALVVLTLVRDGADNIAALQA